MEQIEQKDVLLHYPYESMRPFLKMLHEAAEDESVVSIKMTLYRVADKSKVIDALVEAAENGKEVVVLIELRARFDEANNIEMSAGDRIEAAGVDGNLHLYLVLSVQRQQGFAVLIVLGAGKTGNFPGKLLAQRPLTDYYTIGFQNVNFR